MQARILISARIVAALIATALPVQFAAQDEATNARPQHHHYTLTVMGTLGGTHSFSLGINNRGQVDGFSLLTGDNSGHAVLWSRGELIDLGSLQGGPLSTNNETNPNDRGEVSGLSYTQTPDPNGEDFCTYGYPLICLPFVWQKGVMTALPLLGGNNGYAGGINNRGQVVGVSETPNFDPCSFGFLQVEPVIWDDRNVRELPLFPGDSIGSAGAINDAGQAVGATGCLATNSVRAVQWPNGPNGPVIDLGNLGGGGFNIPFAINNKGQVVGQSTLAENIVYHAFLWQDGVMTDLGTLPGFNFSLANGLNNRGQVVGFSNINGTDDTAVAALWENGTVTDLNTLIPRNSLLFLTEALGINDRGEIAGFGLLSNGEQRGFRLDPCDDAHRNIDGCDYSMVDASTAVTVSPSPTTRVTNPAPEGAPAFSGTANPMLRHFRHHFAPWYRNIGAPAGALNQSRTAASSTVETGTPFESALDASKANLFYEPWGRPKGICEVTESSGDLILTGRCVGAPPPRSPSCTYYASPKCPAGKKAISPSIDTCGGLDQGWVDFARLC